MAACCIDCNPFKCLRRKQGPVGEGQGPDESKSDEDRGRPTQPRSPIELEDIHPLGRHPPTPDPIYEIVSTPNISSEGPRRADTVNYCAGSGSAGQASGTIKGDYFSAPTGARQEGITAAKAPPENPQTKYELEDGSHVVFEVRIRPPPRSLGCNWLLMEVLNRLCRCQERMLEVRAGIHQFQRELPAYSVSVPHTIHQHHHEAIKWIVAVNMYVSYVAGKVTSKRDKEDISMIITNYEIILECASASLAATREAVETSQAGEEAIRRQFQRWVTQTWADIDDFKEQLSCIYNRETFLRMAQPEVGETGLAM
ncbi:hypothetical protein FQN49_006351 [Arthroderma sp. PD_2]|nr:hypothetical protein FQN49_006351 [Arthroderma sp. PD_2]